MRSGKVQQQPRRDAIAGTLAVALMLAGTKWASYLGAPPVFLTDVLLLLGGMHFLAGQLMGRSAVIGQRARLGLLPWLILGWVLARFLVGDQFDVTALRDLAPYVYIGLVVLAGAAVQGAGPERLERTRRILFAALAFQATWFTSVTVVAPWLPEAMPTLWVNNSEIHIFEPRPDVDVPVTGVFISVLLVRLLRGSTRHRLLTLLAIGMGVAAMLLTMSRAGLLGALTAAGFAACTIWSSPHVQRRGRMILAALVPFALAGAIAVVPSTDIGARLAGTFGIAVAPESFGAMGTANARATSWERLWEWTTADDTRLVAGVGFGPSFLVESGASALLVGEGNEERTRSPHNYWLGTLARIGMVGLLLIVGLVWRGVRTAWRVRRIAGNDELRFMVAAVPLALLIPATFGVVLESPFGAVPFWWCVGMLLGLGKSQSDELSAATAREPVRSRRY